jgi:2,6-dihydroxypyridine 3-monooxygenase
MAGFNQTGDSRLVSVRLADGRTAEADLLVCADGWRSATRRHFLPQASPRYAGYIAGRGTLSESEASKASRKLDTNRREFHAEPLDVECRYRLCRRKWMS